MLGRLRIWWIVHRRLGIVAGLALLLLSGAGAAWLLFRPRAAAPPDALLSRVLAAREAGEYDRALRLIREGLKRDTRNAPLRAVGDDLNRELGVRLRMWFPGDRSPSGGPAAGAAVLTLTSADRYCLLLDVSDRCYLYVFHFTSAGDVAILFPNPALVPTGNPFPGGPQRIPDGHAWLAPGPQPGPERVALVAARWPLKALEDVSLNLAAEKDPQRRQALIEQLTQRLQLEERSSAQVPGLVSGHVELSNRTGATAP